VFQRHQKNREDNDTKPRHTERCLGTKVVASSVLIHVFFETIRYIRYVQEICVCDRFSNVDLLVTEFIYIFIMINVFQCCNTHS
jgi:hypothetical protein